MSTNTVGFVQPNFQQGPRELSAYYLPYSAGIILSHAFSSDDVRAAWRVGPIIWQREDLDEAAAKLRDCSIVGFSTYVWNHRYNYALAGLIKSLRPDCRIIFGGPEPAISDPDIFRKEPFIDAIVKTEGEFTFQKMLLMPQDRWPEIPGLLINQQGDVLDTGPSDRILDLDKIPSPYLSGVFDGLIESHPDITWNATLETNRGCPYQCTFCDWGSLIYSKVRCFDVDRVFAELEWIGEHCGFVTIADANFGMFVERDNQIIDKLIEVQKRWGKLESFSMTWAKNQNNQVVDMVERLISESPNFAQGLTVSVQSMDHGVLENIKRRNLDQHKIDKIFEICDRKNIPVYTEVILGLPGETAETWKENFWKIFQAGNHTGINILQAQLLENAEMNLSQKESWGLESMPIYDYMSGSYGDMDLSECVEVVVATKHISRDEMLDLLVWNTFIQTFHINGLTTYVARFLERYQGIGYSEFYGNLENYVRSHPWFSDELSKTKTYFSNWFQHGQAGHPDIGNVQVFGWNLVHRLTLLMQKENRVPDALALIRGFIRDTFDLDESLVNQLMRFQKSYVLDYHQLGQWPISDHYDYDFLGYIQDGTALASSCSYVFTTPEDPQMSLDRFLENMYFARKRNFGKATITKSYQQH